MIIIFKKILRLQAVKIKLVFFLSQVGEFLVFGLSFFEG